MTTALLPILLLTASLNPQAPTSVAMTSKVQTWRAQAVANDVSAYLAERVHEAWALDAMQEPAQFEVMLRWPGPHEVQITIRQAERVWVDRPLKVDDPSSARAMVWLLVRSTVERALMHGAVSTEPTTPPIAPEPEPAPTASATVAMNAPTGPTPTMTTTVATGLPDAAAASPGAATTSSVGGRQMSLSRLWDRPFTLMPGDAVEGSVMMRTYADPSSGFSAGLSVQARLQLDYNFIIGGEVGFYSENKATNLDLHHVPIGVFAGYSFGEELPLELGVSATLDGRVVSVQGTQMANPTNSLGVAVGLLAGAYARTHYSLWNKDSLELRVVGEFAMNVALLRSAYVVAAERFEDGPLVVTSAVGLQWRWH